MSSKGDKEFDAVRMMREIRDPLSRKLMNMSHEEQRRYINEQLERQGDEEQDEARQRATA